MLWALNCATCKERHSPRPGGRDEGEGEKQGGKKGGREREREGGRKKRETIILDKESPYAWPQCGHILHNY